MLFRPRAGGWTNEHCPSQLFGIFGEMCTYVNLMTHCSFRQDVLKWNAWGYRDSGFFVNEKGIMEFAGRRYLIAGRELPRLQPLMAKYGLDTNLKSFSPVGCALLYNVDVHAPKHCILHNCMWCCVL